VETFTAFVARGTGAFAAGEKGWLGCAAIEAVIEAGLFTQADVGQTHAAGWAVIVGTTASVWWDRWQSDAAFQAMFRGLRLGFRGARFFCFRFSAFGRAS
jgi:hypothetical protein